MYQIGRNKLQREVEQVIKPLRLTAGPRNPIGRPTLIGAASARGFRSVCLSVNEERVSQQNRPLQINALTQIQATAWQLLRTLDK